MSFDAPIASFTVVHSSTPGSTSGTVGVSDVSFDIFCFSRGSRIETPHGPRAVEDLAIGDLVVTKDSGVQAIKWIGRKKVSAQRLATEQNLRPVRLLKDAFGDGIPCRDMMISPQHKILISDWRAEMYFASSEILAPAKGLLNDRTIRIVNEPADIEYIHMMFEKHEIVTVDNLRSESFFVGDNAVSTLDQEARHELFSLFPELGADQASFGATARRALKVREASVLSQ
ncbi:Hint domain-containing protein [Roseobacter sp. CCS2]|uniref:Hint domain-containing protein n=1 Tax=Roseobacter sp. CCS2 TaxID=391593 RepID=UPI0000F40555|nr:type I secretion target repeat protein [Roseobacter sp. CCS2]